MTDRDSSLLTTRSSLGGREVVVFDLDDTLYNERDFLLSAYGELARWIESVSEARGVLEFMTATYADGVDVFGETIERFGLGIEKEEMVARYRTHKPAISLSPDARETLERLGQRAVLGLITDGRSVTQRNKVDALQLQRYIPEGNIIISEEFGYAKPAPEPYLYFEQRYPEAGSYTYVGNSLLKDFVAPNALGWRTVCLRDNGRNIRPQLFDQAPPTHLPQLCINKLSELI